MYVPRLALALALVVLAAGCTGTPAAGVKSVNGVARENLLIQGIGLNVTSDAANGTVTIGPATSLNASSLQACATRACANVGIPAGFIVAEGSLVSLNNISLNARGPDHDSVVYFYDHGDLAGQFLRWNDAATRFELSRDTDVLGNLTARHHVGTVTTVVISGGLTDTQVQIATAALEGNEATIYLRGSGTLAAGTATIAFPAPFKVLVGGNMTAQVTPTSKGAGLYVSEKARDHVKIDTLDGSATNQTFDYVVYATRAASGDFQTVLPG